MNPSHAASLRQAILDGESLIGATFSGHARGASVPWTRVTVRPVLLRGGRHLQFGYYTEQRGITKNEPPDESAARLDELLATPFKHVTVRTTMETLELRIPKSGDSHLARHAPPATIAPADLSHDRAKSYLLTPETAGAMLDTLGMVTPEGDVRAARARKLRQINEFLKLLRQSGRLEPLLERTQQVEGDSLHIVDFGCGNAYLTFAMYQYLHEVASVPVSLVGVDVDEQAVQRNSERAARLGWEGLTFQVGRIRDALLPERPDIVLALHACDTATDEALARAIAWQSPLVVAVPCCHHDIQVQLERAPVSVTHRPLLRHGILRERLGDVLTDALRAQVLRLLGYQTDVLQFISPEHTAKNLMIRATWSGVSERARYLDEYRELTSAWGVTPALERLLAEQGIALDA
jgi:SAM-dependent methyltransferase